MAKLSATQGEAEQRAQAILRNEVVTVRYQVADIDRSIGFYTQRLGFSLEARSGPALAAVSIGNLRLILSGPGSSGARPMPDGRRQEHAVPARRGSAAPEEVTRRHRADEPLRKVRAACRVP